MIDLFYTCSEEDRLRGYTEDNGYACLFCDFKTEEGIIYQVDDLYMTAEKYMQHHIEEHGGVFSELIKLDKKYSGFSDQQSKIMKLINDGLTDHEIQTQLNIGSVSTIRNHRHTLREKEKQAKVMVTLMGLLGHSKKVKPHNTATMVDHRYDVTVDQAIDIVNKYFEDGKLKTFSMKEKNKLIVLREIMKNFTYGKQYKAKEMDEILKAIYEDDYVQIRRYLIEYGFMDRTRDCRFYWVKDKVKSEEKMSQKKIDKNRRKELMNKKYFSEPVEILSGVYQIKNLENNKIFIGSARNIKKLEGLKFQLNMGSFMNKALQKDWQKYGEDQFEISVLESFEETDEMTSVAKKINEMKKAWLEKLQPYDEKGYHRKAIKR